MPDDNAYDAFIKHSQNWVFDFPDTPDLREMLKLRMTPEDARFLSSFPHFPTTLEELSARFDLPPGEMSARMAPLLKEGILYEVEGKSAVRYSLTDGLFFLGRMKGWLGEDSPWSRRFAPVMNRYYDQHFGPDFMGHPTKGLRAIPVNTAVKDASTILPYEDLLAYVEREDYHTVSSCACRHNINMDSTRENCSHEVEVCLHFGRLGRYIVKHGMGRKIEKEETLAILKRCADKGLVHAISNTKKGMDTICNCCSCCCIFLRPIQLSTEVQREYHQRSNYCLEINGETCIACGLCAKRCPINAITLEDRKDAPVPEPGQKPSPKDLKQVAYNPDTCIGCGVCAHKCPTDSLAMVRRESVEDIPENFFEAGVRMIQERGKDPSAMF